MPTVARHKNKDDQKEDKHRFNDISMMLAAWKEYLRIWNSLKCWHAFTLQKLFPIYLCLVPDCHPAHLFPRMCCTILAPAVYLRCHVNQDNIVHCGMLAIQVTQFSVLEKPLRSAAKQVACSRVFVMRECRLGWLLFLPLDLVTNFSSEGSATCTQQANWPFTPSVSWDIHFSLHHNSWYKQEIYMHDAGVWALSDDTEWPADTAMILVCWEGWANSRDRKNSGQIAIKLTKFQSPSSPCAVSCQPRNFYFVWTSSASDHWYSCTF